MLRRPGGHGAAGTESLRSRAATGPREISHFDATARRREKMRQSATSKPSAPAAAAVSAEPPAASFEPSSSGTCRAHAGCGPGRRGLEKFLIKFVVEQTGYPPEVVELDADLEADLGIDSIKKAQLFGELREYFDVTPGEDLTLDDFPTLRHVLNYLQGAPVKGACTARHWSQPQRSCRPSRLPRLCPRLLRQFSGRMPGEPASSATAAATSATGPAGEDLEKFLINFVVEQTGYPPEVVELDADLEADLGIDSIKKAQLFGELREYFDVTPSEESHAGRFSDTPPRAQLSARHAGEEHAKRACSEYTRWLVGQQCRQHDWCRSTVALRSLDGTEGVPRPFAWQAARARWA